MSEFLNFFKISTTETISCIFRVHIAFIILVCWNIDALNAKLVSILKVMITPASCQFLYFLKKYVKVQFVIIS